MKKYLISIGLILTIALLSSCSAKKYDLSSKPTVVFKTTMGDIKIGFYKKAAPKSVELFLKLCKEKRYSNTLVDEILNLPPSNFLISMGGTVKWEAIDDAARKELELEIVQKDKKIEKGELLYSAKNEVFGFFSINTNSTAIERNEEDVKNSLKYYYPSQ